MLGDQVSTQLPESYAMKNDREGGNDDDDEEDEE